MQARIMKNPLANLSNKIPTSLNKLKGATMVEYSIMVALIAAVAITAVKLFGTNVSGLFNSIVGSYPG
jgi:Flp pilus assembly pilin Flp